MQQSSHTVAEVARRLDHAVLRPEATDRDLTEAAAMCVARGVGCLCVRPCDVAAAVRFVAGSDVVIASVVGFPHGSQTTQVKAAEARRAISDGGREIDMVMQIGAFLSGRSADVRSDIAAVVAEAKPRGVLVKVILETCFLSLDEVARACLLAEAAAADMVKTSTGFGTGGATPEAVETMLRAVGGRLGVKASGGIRSWEACVRYLGMGCARIGVGDAAQILDGHILDGGP
ncbi:MAG: deoxyribose-phosphate aldolase [Planctomycetota bacterium]